MGKRDSSFNELIERRREREREERSVNLNPFCEAYRGIKSQVTTSLLGISIRQIYATFVRLDILYFLIISLLLTVILPPYFPPELYPPG